MNRERRGPRLSAVAPAVLALALVLAACTTPVDRARELARQGRTAEALAALDDEARAMPGSAADRAVLRGERERLVTAAMYPWLAQAEWARSGGRLAEAREWVDRVLSIDPQQARALALREEIERSQRAEAALQRAREEQRAGRTDAARRTLEQALRDAPRHAGVRALLNQMTPPPALEASPREMGEHWRRPVTLEFREAPLRTVFEALSRSHGLNFVFDREVRADTRVTLALREIALDEALRVILVTQQLDRKVLNANTLLIYPATQAKQREHQDVVTRTLYLANADAKTAVGTLRAIAKSQDMQPDERLNAIVVRDTPAVVRMIEDLVAAIDLPEPEVIIDVEVLEVASQKIDDLGLQWPDQVALGVFGAGGAAASTVPLNRDLRLTGRIANPVLLASLRSTDGATRTLSNPTIRARNREKAQVHVGDKLPVFTTTSTANVGVSASVSYLDVGIKLDVEPTVQIDNEVVIKVALEVSNLVRTVPGPQGSVAYQIGTRRTTTSLRLRDGETQVLAGLMKDEDLRSTDGLPGLSSLPVLGRLFGARSDTRSRNEVVLLMTPRIVRNVPLPDAALTLRAGGTALNPGAEPLRLADRARAAAAPATGAAAGRARAEPAEPAGPASSPPAAPGPVLELATSGNAAVGETVSVTLRNPGELRITGELQFDSALLRNAAGGDDDARALPFDLPPGGSRAIVLRVLPAAAGRSIDIGIAALQAQGAGGSVSTVEVQGSGRIEVGRAR